MEKIEDIYSTEEEVKSELKRRWMDKDLEKKLYDFLGGNIPEPFLKEPRAVLARQLATPDNEYKAYYEKAKKLGIKPLNFEFLDDVFITTNHGKACLAKMTLYDLEEKQKNHKFPVIYSIKIGGNDNEKKKFRDIMTLWGENFVDFHHRILHKKYDSELYDGSDWYNKMGGKAENYYIYCIALLAIKHVFFENMETGREDKFFNNIFLPAFNFIKKEFGVKPLIMPIAPINDMGNEYWWCYPKEIKGMI